MGIFEHNPKLTFLACIYLYLIFHFILVEIAITYAVDGCGVQARHTGVLVHQALTYTDDADLMLKVGVKILYHLNSIEIDYTYTLFLLPIDGIFCYASVTYESEMRYKYSKL